MNASCLRLHPRCSVFSTQKSPSDRTAVSAKTESRRRKLTNASAAFKINALLQMPSRAHRAADLKQPKCTVRIDTIRMLAHSFSRGRERLDLVCEFVAGDRARVADPRRSVYGAVFDLGLAPVLILSRRRSDCSEPTLPLPVSFEPARSSCGSITCLFTRALVTQRSDSTSGGSHLARGGLLGVLAGGNSHIRGARLPSA